MKMKIVLISGFSGSGKSVALTFLEDNGFNCVDNLPPEMLPQLVALHEKQNESKLSVSIDIRSKAPSSLLLQQAQSLRQAGHDVSILFLEADESVLIKRFSETRRSHPLTLSHITLSESLQQEAQWLSPLREHAYCIDTSALNAQQLRQHLQQWLNHHGENLLVTLESFGFKYGTPRNNDFIFDVRSLPNPHYVTELREHNGTEAPIQQYFAHQPLMWKMIQDIEHFLLRWLPFMQRENRTYVNIGIGCTGGQHRSVFIVEELGKRLTQQKFKVLIRHRQLS